METFCGKAHLPGADKEWNIELEIDWGKKEINVHIDEAPEGVADGPGLVVQTYGEPVRYHSRRLRTNEQQGVIFTAAS